MKMLKQTQHDIKNELLMARQVQQSIMPQTAPEFPGLHLFLWYQPIETVCGDMYDFIQLSPNRLGIFIGDVSGHSISSALVSMVSKMSLYLHTKKRMTPHLLFELLNEDLIGNIGTSHFLTCFYGIFDRKDNSFTYSRAGIPAPIVIRANGQIVPLASYGTVLGILNDPFVEQRRIYLNKGDRCIFFTDGIYEIEETGNGAMHVYGYKKFVEKLVETCPLPIHEVVPYIKNEFSGFKHEDDYTLIACEAADDHTHALEDKYPGFNALDHLSLLTVTTMAEVDKYISFLEKEMDRNKCTSPAFKDAKNNALHYIKLCLETESDALIKNSVTILHTFTPSDFKICVTARNADFTEHAKQNKSILTNPKGNAVSILLPRMYQK
jgi:sigma-B regulation protein RsbU (phosphoserine phosphatase)